MDQLYVCHRVHSHIWEDANADDLMMNGCMQQLHDASYHVVLCTCQSIENRKHPLPATGRSLEVVLHSHWGRQLGGWSPSSSQMDSSNMCLKVKKEHQHINHRASHQNSFFFPCYSLLKRQGVGFGDLEGGLKEGVWKGREARIMCQLSNDSDSLKLHTRNRTKQVKGQM